MTWEIVVITLLVVVSNIGQSYFTTWRITSRTFLENFFKKETPLREIRFNVNRTEDNTSTLSGELDAIHKILEGLQSQIDTNAKIASGGYEQLYVLIMRGSTIRIDQLIDDRYAQKIREWEKRERDVTELAKKIEEHGRVILKGRS